MTFDEIMFCYKKILSAIDKNDVEAIGYLNQLMKKAKESQPVQFIPTEKLKKDNKWLHSRIKGYKTQIKNLKEEIERLKTDRRKKLLSIRELRESVKELKKPRQVKPRKNPGVLYYNNEVNDWIELMDDLNGGGEND